MNKFIAVLSVLTLCSTLYVLNSISNIELTTTPYSQENVERVRAGIAKPYNVVGLPTIKVEVPINQVKCMQANIYFETRNQSDRGKTGTGWVTQNRVNDERFPSTVCDVVLEARLNVRGNPIRNRCQFSWYCDGLGDTPDLTNKLEREAWETSGNIALTMVRSCVMNVDPQLCPPDPTMGALFYHADSVQPNWSYTEVAVIDNHTYYTIQ